MSEDGRSRSDYLSEYNDRIPQEYRDAGWRVLIIASGHTYSGDEAHIAVLQNDSDIAPNGYYNTFGFSKEDAVDGAIRALLAHVSVNGNN